MTKTATRPITVSDDKHKEPVTIQPGEDVPDWAVSLVKPEYLSEDRPTAAGTDLFQDQTYQSLVRAAGKVGLDVDQTWSPDQLAAMIRAKLFDDEIAARYDEDDEDKPEAAADAMAQLFAGTNQGGNVNAPDLVEPPKTEAETKSKSKASAPGGANS